MAQFFLLPKVCSHSVCVHCMRDVFSIIRGSKKATMQDATFWVWFLKLKEQDTHEWITIKIQIQRWAEKRKKRKKTQKAKWTTNWICFSLTEAIEKSKNRKVAYHIDCKFLVQKWFIVKNVIRLLSVRTHKLWLWLFCNLQYYYSSAIICRYFSKTLPKL